MWTWRFDVENCPKDRPFIALDPYWAGREWCIYSVKTVQWDYINEDRDDSPNPEFGWVYGYDHERYGALYLDEIEAWMEIPELPEGYIKP